MTTSRCEAMRPGEPPDEPAARLLATPPPAVGTAAVAMALRERYRLEARVTALLGERDANFLVELADGSRRVFKVFNDAEDAATRALQTGALLHLERVGSACAVPRLIPTRDGAAECDVEADGGRYRAILISVVPGEPADLGRAGPALRRDLGRTAAALGRALAGYNPPAARRVLLWDPMQLGRMAGVVAGVSDPARRRWLDETVARFLAETRPKALGLPAQVIHGDLNGGNVLLTGGTIGGVVDFGDLVRAPRISEAAIAAAYVVAADPDPVAAIGDVVEGYDAASPLEEDEVALVHDLVLARLALRVLIHHWRAGLGLAGRATLPPSGAAAERRVEAFAAMAPGAGRDAILARWRARRRAR